MNPMQNERTYTMLLLNDSIVIHFLLSLSRNFVQPSLQLRLFSDNVSTSISFGRRFFFFCEFLPCTKVSSFFSTLSRKCFDGKFSLLFPLLFSHSLSNTIYKFRTTFFYVSPQNNKRDTFCHLIFQIQRMENIALHFSVFISHECDFWCEQIALPRIQL